MRTKSSTRARESLDALGGLVALSHPAHFGRHGASWWWRRTLPAQGGKEVLGTNIGAEDCFVSKSGYCGRSAAPNVRDLDLIRRLAVVGAKAGFSGVAGLDEDNGGEMTSRHRVWMILASGAGFFESSHSSSSSWLASGGDAGESGSQVSRHV